MTDTRRAFLIQSAAVSAAFGTMGASGAAQAQAYARPNRLGELVADPAGLLDLPPGFSYTLLSRTGDAMTDGHRTPGKPDGMAAFPARELGRDKIILVRNHELQARAPETPFATSASAAAFDRSKAYDVTEEGAVMPGGTTTLVYDLRAKRVETAYLSLVGTTVNCAGGPTPWGSWLSCEETENRASDVRGGKDHGWVFEVPARPTGGPVDPVPLTGMGRFRHEAAAVDPRSGAVYQTEDENDGLIYRFLPNAPGELAKGGRLQALAIKGRPGFDTRNWAETDRIAQGARFEVEWIDVPGVDNPDKDLRRRLHQAGAALFARGEGMWFGLDEVYWTCTSGGVRKAGQIFRYRPSRFEGRREESREPGVLELFLEPNDPSKMQHVDNIAISSRGLIAVCEDGAADNYLRLMDRRGNISTLGRVAQANNSELCGACFSPNGRTLFVNIQTPGVTLAIDGPFAA